MKYSVIDLFSGAGGLSLGFLQTNKYTIRAFVEKNDAAKQTYIFNHPGARSYDDVIGLDYKRVRKECGNIDVVIGGPPCQGFSNANRQHNQLINMNNQLVKEYVRAVSELHPLAFVMENVSMLKSNVHLFYYTEMDKKQKLAEKYSLKLVEFPIELFPTRQMSDDIITLCSDRCLQKYLRLSDKSMIFLKNIHRYLKNTNKFSQIINKYSKEMPIVLTELSNITTHRIPLSIKKNIRCLTLNLQNYSSKDIPIELSDALDFFISIQHLISYIDELNTKGVIFRIDTEKGIKAIVKAYSVCDYIHHVLSSPENGYTIVQGVLNAADFGAPQKRQRFVMIGIRNTISNKITMPRGTFTEDKYRTVRDAIEDLEELTPSCDIHAEPQSIKKIKYPKNSLQKYLRNSDILTNHTITATRDVAKARFVALKQGQNFHNLSTELKTNTYTDISRTQNTIYQRLSYDEPSGTVLNVRKSMWVHPTKDRAISIREAARLQTFPDSFTFYGNKDAQYQQIGNAVPPILGKAIAMKVVQLLDERLP